MKFGAHQDFSPEEVVEALCLYALRIGKSRGHFPPAMDEIEFLRRAKAHFSPALLDGGIGEGQSAQKVYIATPTAMITWED